MSTDALTGSIHCPVRRAEKKVENNPAVISVKLNPQ
jgi:hypothetical protein